MTETKSVLLITSNGWGMGHLIRQLTIKAHMPANVRCTILTLSQAAAVAAQPDLEYAPSYTQPWITKAQWHSGYLRDRIIALAEEVEADVIAFDGVVPYVGLMDALRRLPAARVWLRRGLWRRGADAGPLQYSQWFDCIITPSDLGDALDSGPTAERTDATKVGVITDASPAAAMSRVEAAQHLGLDPDRPTLLLNIGSSTIADLDALDRVLAEHPDWQICSTNDELSRGKNLATATITPIRGAFPLWKYLSCIDLAVTSVGYNAAHEFVCMEVPALYVPSPTVTDDQDARAAAIAQQGAGWTPSGTATVASLLSELLTDADKVAAAKQACASISAAWTQGAPQAVDIILGTRVTRPRETGLQSLQLTIRVVFERTFGNLLRRARRKHHSGLTISEELTRELMSAAQPFEHLLPGSSLAYRQRRTKIAEHWLS